MVAHLVRLKLSLLRNGLRRSVPQLVGMAVAALYALGVTAVCVGGLVTLRFAGDADLARSLVVVLGSAVTLGWLVVPVLFTGVDQTLDPLRFATFAVPRRQLLLGLLAAALVGLPGVVLSVLALTTAVTWSRSPQAVVVALVAAAVAVLTCVTLSRVATSGLSALGQSRRGREIASTTGGLLLVVAGLSVSWVSDRVGRPDLMHTLAGLLAWTPLGLAWAAPADVAAGALGTGLLRLLLAVIVLGGAAGPVGPAAAPRPGEPPLGQRSWRRPAGRVRVVRPAARHAHRCRRGPLGDVLATRPALPRCRSA